MILVTGGTGKTGTRLVHRLVTAGHPVRVASRSGTATEGATEAIRFDWFDTSGHDAALQGVQSVYLIAPVGAADPYPATAAFVERALRHGVRRFVLLSASSLPEGGPAMGAVHRLLREKAPEWAVLRPTWFQQNFSEGPHRETIRNEGALYSATGGGRVPFIDARDIADAGFRALTDATPHNTDHVLTGPRTLTYGEAANIIGDTLGRPVRHINLSEAELAERWAGFGLEPEYAALLAGMDTAIASGAEDRTTDGVFRVTGRGPRDFADFARDATEAWR